MTSTREDLQALVAESLREVAYTCTRTWEAWQYGTMTDEDFTPAWEDDELTGSMADEIVKAGYVKPPTAEGMTELWEFIEASDEQGETVAIQDASRRTWIVGSNEEGDHWANSFEHEEDDRPMPCLLAYASIKYPVTILTPVAP